MPGEYPTTVTGPAPGVAQGTPVAPAAVPDVAAATPAEGSPKDFTNAVAETEKKMLCDALEKTNWNLTKAAELLGISFRSMRYNVKKYNLSRDNKEA
jgi:two-component system response regulator PilR (NtrC family)